MAALSTAKKKVTLMLSSANRKAFQLLANINTEGDLSKLAQKVIENKVIFRDFKRKESNER